MIPQNWNMNGMSIACACEHGWNACCMCLNMDRTLIACTCEDGWNACGVCLNTDRTFIMCAYEHEWNVYLLFIFALFTPFEFSENIFSLPIPTEEHVMALARFEVNRP